MNASSETTQHESKTSGMAVTSMVLGVLSFLFNFVTGLPAVILGIVSLVRINNSRGALRGSAFAITGIVTGCVTAMLFLPILIALLLPAVQAARDAARANVSMNNMKMISLGMANYESQNGTLPAAGGDGATGLSWRVHILPFIEQQALYEEFHLDEPWDSEHNRKLIARMPEVFQAAGVSDEVGPGKTVYLAVTGPGAMFQGESTGPSQDDILDGRSNTIMLVEADPDQAVEWTRPVDWQFDPANPMQGLGNLRRNQFLVGMADMHVQRVNNEINPDTLRGMMTRAGNETLESF